MADTFYHRHMTQRVSSDPYWQYNCTAYCAAMLINDATLGGTNVSGKLVRAYSNEPKPESGSPGLNIKQVQGVARYRYGVTITDKTGGNWTDVVNAVKAHRRVLLQIEYRELGGARCQSGGDFGHAVVLIRMADDGVRIRASDPLCASSKPYDPDVLHEAARVFARGHGLTSGLWWAQSRVVPKLG